MSIRQLWLLAATLAAVTGLAILTIDGPVARALSHHDPDYGWPYWLNRGLTELDRVSGMDWKRGRLAVFLIVLGAALWWWRRPWGRAALILGLVQAGSRVGAGYLKPLTGRLRPSEAIAGDKLDDTFWHDKGISFPSGHVGFYAGLTIAVVLLWPRARIPALVVLALVCLTKLARNAHFVSDVTGAVAIAALCTAVAGTMLPAQPRMR
jgi:membrane-associated phospholipid phosphatase